MCVSVSVCVFRRSSQSNPDHRDGPCLWLTPHSAWVIKLLEAPRHASPLININYRGSCSLALSSPLLSSPLLSSTFLSSTQLDSSLRHHKVKCSRWKQILFSLCQWSLIIIYSSSPPPPLSSLCQSNPSFFILHKGWPLIVLFSYHTAVILSKKWAVVFLYISLTVLHALYGLSAAYDLFVKLPVSKWGSIKSLNSIYLISCFLSLTADTRYMPSLSPTSAGVHFLWDEFLFGPVERDGVEWRIRCSGWLHWD